jgi:hypothetical protein
MPLDLAGVQQRPRDVLGATHVAHQSRTKLGGRPSPRCCASNGLRRKSFEHSFAVAVSRHRSGSEQII